MELVIWMGYGFYSFYVAGDVIGLSDTNLKTFALVGLGLGCVRELLFTFSTLAKCTVVC